MSNAKILSKIPSNLANTTNGKLLTIENGEIVWQENYAWESANVGISLAQSAFESGNSGIIIAQAAFAAANNVAPQIEPAFNQANTGVIQAQAAFAAANNVAPQIEPAFNQANTGVIQAQAAFAAANNEPIAKSAFNQANTGVIQAQAAFAQANTGIIQAQGAFAAANNVAPQIEPAFNQANTGVIQAQAAFAQANTGIIQAQGAFAQANNEPIAKSAFVQANTAITNSANASVLSVGTVPGDRGVSSGSIISSFIEYNGITKTAGQFDGGSSTPSNTIRLNYDGNFYATTFYGSGYGLNSIPNSSLSNSSFTINETAISLGSSATVTAAAGTLTGSTLASGVTGSSLTSVGNITSGTWSGLFGAVSGANLTNLTADNLSGTIPSAVLGNSTHYVGTTAVALNRASGSQTLTGVNIDGSAATLTTARNIALTGDVTGSVNFDGSSNVTITATVVDDSHNHIVSNVDGLQTELDSKLPSSYFNAANTLTLIKTVDGSGTGLDADLLDGQHGSYYSSNTYSESTYYKKSGGEISGPVTISGNLIVTGTTTTVSANNLSISDNMIYLNEDLSGNTNPDLGFAGAYNDGTYHHAGFFRDATDGVWKVFDNYQPEPDESVWIDTSNTSFRIASFQANTITGTLFSGSGSALTNLTASNLTGTIPSAVLGNSTHYVGTTAIALNRASGSQTLTGVNIDGSAGSAPASALTGSTLASGVTSSSLTSVGTITSGTWSGSFGAVSGANLTTLNASNLASGTVPVARLSSIPNSSLANTSVTVNGTTISLGGSGTVTAAAGTLTGTTLASGVTGSSLTSVGTITSGTWSGSFGAVSGANLTGLTAGNLSGTIPSAVLGNSTHYVGTTAITLNRASGSQTLTGVSIDGNAATATALQTARTIGGVSFNGTANINLPGVNTAGNQNTSGNAATATKLATARAINGTNFDGSAAITTANWGTARTLTIGSTGKSVDGSGNVSWSLAEIGAAATSHTHSYLPLSGGTVSGDTYFEGPILWKVSSSDAAIQRADARDDATNYSRLHWYGVSDAAATSNFRHAWYDGAAYINIDVSSSNINFARTTGTANLQVHGNTVLHAGNYTSYSPTLTGSGASGSWGINVTGSSASCTGNAATATKLATARAINGTNFDGSAAITTANWGTARTLTIGSTGKSVNGSGNISWTLAEIGAYASSNPSGYTTNTGTVTSVGGTGSVSGLTLSGTVTTSGNLTLGGTLSASINNITDEYRLFNNMGDNHGTRTNFNYTTASAYGFRYVQGNTNGPAWGGSQNYGFFAGLGNDYNGNYGCQFYWARNVTNPYISIRYLEGGTWGSWTKISAAYADTAGSAPANGGTSSYVTINYNNNSASTYQMLWGSGNGVYGTAAIYCNPSTNYLYAGSFYCGSWFRSSGQSGWYNESYTGGMYMIDTTWVRVYNGKAFYVPNQIAATGNITAYYSDERLKTKLGNIENALDIIHNLNGFRYVNNDLAKQYGYKEEKVQLGVSAQEVEKVLPEAVSIAPFDMETAELTGEITSKTGENYKTVDYSKLVPVLIEAIKDLSNKVENQQKLIDTLYNK